MPTVLFLLDRPRELDRAELAAAASRAYRLRVEPQESDPSRTDGLVAGQAPAFVLAVRGRVVLVHTRARPYFPDPHEVARRTRDPRIAEAVRAHRAWFSFDLVESRDGLTAAAALRELGVLAGHLDLSGAVVYGVPEDGLLRFAEHELALRLRRGELVELLDPGRAATTVVREGRDEPPSGSGTRQAQRRWGEFERAFRRRGSGSQFAVRLAAAPGKPAWLVVDGLEEGRVVGHFEGDRERIAVPAGDVLDWLVLEGGDLRGGFTLGDGAEEGGAAG